LTISAGLKECGLRTNRFYSAVEIEVGLDGTGCYFPAKVMVDFRSPVPGNGGDVPREHGSDG